MPVVILDIAVSGTILANYELAHYYGQCDHVILLLINSIPNGAGTMM